MPQKTCPHCGKELHENASFCPYCAQTVNARKEVRLPRHVSGRALYSALIVLAVLILAGSLAVWLHARPGVHDNGTAEVVYTGKTGSYRLCFAKEAEPAVPLSANSNYYEVDYAYRDNVQLYVTDTDSGGLATEDFMQGVDSITAEIICSDAYMSTTCTEPQLDIEPFPNAAATIFVDYNIVSPGEHQAELVCTVTMKNGDVIRLHQQRTYQSVTTYRYTPQDVPMNTIRELQALVDELSATVGEKDKVYLQLPPVVYEGGLVLEDRNINLVGSMGADGQRTTFTGPTRASYQSVIHEFNNIDFVGSGEGVGVEAAARVHLTNCRVSGWETGFLASGNSWINADQTVFEDNTVGLHFNADSGAVSDEFYVDNVFRNNGTAVLLERVPSPTSLSFPGTLFTGNGTDIDNRCGQELGLDEAVFE